MTGLTAHTNLSYCNLLVLLSQPQKIEGSDMVFHLISYAYAGYYQIPFPSPNITLDGNSNIKNKEEICTRLSFFKLFSKL